MESRRILYSAPVSVSGRPVSLAATLRPAWRVPLITLLFGACRNQKARRPQLIVLNWAVRSEASVEALVAHMDGESSARQLGVRFEPALVRAVNIGVGAGVFSVDSNWLRLTTAGELLLEQVVSHDLYASERELLGRLPKPLPHSTAEQLLKGGL